MVASGRILAIFFLVPLGTICGGGKLVASKNLNENLDEEGGCFTMMVVVNQYRLASDF